ncbi:MAG: hypothetical protein ACXABY_37530 [Candidatus Thorarchaeota archaeon]|jgi:hypothetical protein
MTQDKIAFFFPLEGPQSPVIGFKLYQAPTKARRVHQESDEVVGFDLSKLPLETSQGDICDTALAQPAIMPRYCFRLATSGTST